MTGILLLLLVLMLTRLRCERNDDISGYSHMWNEYIIDKDIPTGPDHILVTKIGETESQQENNLILELNQPVYISLTVIQKRLKFIYRSLLVLLNGSYLPTKIYLFV